MVDSRASLPFIAPHHNLTCRDKEKETSLLISRYLGKIQMTKYLLCGLVIPTTIPSSHMGGIRGWFIQSTELLLLGTT